MKPRYHQSNLKHFFKCPKMFELSLKHEPTIGTSTQNVMREGNIFEHFVFDTSKHGEELDELIGKKKKETIDAIREQANQVRPIFVKGEPYVKLEHETDEYILGGEADYIGAVKYVDENGQEFKWDKCIADLKKTGDINRVWGWKITKEDYLQAIQYTYIIWKNTGELLPYVFIVCEDTYINPIVLCLEVKITEKTFAEFYEPFIKDVHTTEFHKANAGEDYCLGYKNKAGRCWFLQYCKAGCNIIGGYKYIEIDELMTEYGND